MSLKALNWAMNLPVKPAGKKLTLLILADFAMDNGKTAPALSTLRKNSGLGTDAIAKFLDELMIEGAITNTTKIAGNDPERRVFQLNPIKELELKQVERKERTPIAEDMQEAFKIYQLYPRKVSRPKALKAISKAVKAYGFEVVKNGTELFSDLWKKSGKEMEYCPHPSTFFGNERFNDSPEAWGLASGKKITEGPSYAEVLNLCKEKAQDLVEAGKWAAGFHGAWKKKQWQKNGVTIDWKIELQSQIARWRGQNLVS